MDIEKKYLRVLKKAILEEVDSIHFFVENIDKLNYMQNKKLIDRGTRLIAELAGLSYEEACLRLHETMEEVEPRQRLTRDAPSPVALALERLGAMAPDGPTQ